nr:membrane dipeptidase [Phycisphaerales bacterium]
VEGGVRACLATIFTEPGGSDAVGFPPGDAEAAHAAGVRQVEIYADWARQGHFTVGFGRGGGPGSDPLTGRVPPDPRAIQMGILVEGADPIRSPEELEWWVGRGVVAVGLAWARPSRYAGGNSTPRLGLTERGREMIQAADDSGVVHDVSHLSDLAMDELFERARGRVIASHSNSRALLGGDNQRHLRDESIRTIAARGGVVGLNLYGKFLVPEGSDREPTIDDVADHADHIAAVAQSRRCVGLGSDMDGGFGASVLPAGIRRHADIERLAESLLARGWSDAEVEGFAWGNWSRFWGNG